MKGSTYGVTPNTTAVINFCNSENITFGQYQVMETLGYLECNGRGNSYSVMITNQNAYRRYLQRDI